MNQLINAMTTNDTFTENGAVTNSTTGIGTKILDLFFTIGALRNEKDTDRIIRLWSSAFGENPKLALQLLLWARDVRGGAGERKVFRIIFDYLKKNNPEWAKAILPKIPEVGRWDDLLQDSFAFDFIKNNLGNGLLCKWFPRRGPIFTEFARYSGMTFSQLRHTIVNNSKTVEQQMSSHQWDQIKYKSVPSRAMKIYSNAFGKRDAERFGQYKADLVSGKTTIKAATLYPYDLITSVRNGKDVTIIAEQWKALPNYYSDENILVVADTSGSMTGGCGSVAPIDVSVSLAMYIAERNTGAFRDCFITFSVAPKIQILTGTNFKNRFDQLMRSDWGYNTDLQAVFELILNTAVKKSIKASDMPKKIIIISDMEFDSCCSNSKASNFENIKDLYKRCNYTVPNLVFWNVNSRGDNYPVKHNELGVALVSGCSPSILKSVLGDINDPYSVLLKTIDVERYRF